jgi:ribosome maturation factor RimP
MSLAERIERLIGPTVEGQGFEVVRVLLSGANRPRLQVMVDRRDGSGVTLDDCALVSRSVSALLDAEDPFRGAFSLEVSSPGIDRPLVKLRDFERFAGFEARIETTRPIGGRRRFKGRLLGIEDGVVRISMGEEEAAIAFSDIARAKLMMTDELIAKTEERKGR